MSHIDYLEEIQRLERELKVKDATINRLTNDLRIAYNTLAAIAEMEVEE